MVALKKYDRIEASGLWRAGADAQRREVIVTLGDASLTVKAPNEQPLAHWSLAAIARRNPGQTPAIFHPDGDPGEELELPDSEAEMIEAIETLRKAVERARPHPGRLRWLGRAMLFAAIIWGVVIWLPGALQNHTLRVVPDVARRDIGAALFTRVQRVSGPPCATTANHSALSHLAERVSARNLAVMRSGLDEALLLPGGLILLSRTLVEDHEDPAVVAGFAAAELALLSTTDPLHELLVHAGPMSALRLLTTGQLPEETLDSYAEHLLTSPRRIADTDTLLATFADLKIASAPYAYARDITGESVLPLIEADPLRSEPDAPVVLGDGDWVRLQNICAA